MGGEKATQVQFVSFNNSNGTKRSSPEYTNYPVYNLDQTKNLDPRFLKKPIKISDADRVLMSYVLEKTEPQYVGQAIGNWMAAAHLGISLKEKQGVNMQALNDQLDGKQHIEIFRQANEGQRQVRGLEETFLAFKDAIITQAIANRRAEEQSLFDTAKATKEAKTAATEKPKAATKKPSAKKAVTKKPAAKTTKAQTTPKTTAKKTKAHVPTP